MPHWTMPDPVVPRPLRGWPVLLLAWLPLAIALAVAIVLLTGGSASNGLQGGLVTALLSFLLGLAVWWLTGALPWTPRAGIRFMAIHVVAAFVGSALWWMAATAVMATLNGGDPIASNRAWWHSTVVGWDLMVGMAMYGLAGGLSYAIRFQHRLQEERLSLARAVADARAAQLAVLEARLDPHFLFNTLHSVAALVRRDPSRAEDTIDSLGDLLRETLHERHGQPRSLSDEWRFTSQYLELEQLRLGDRLHLETHLDTEAMACEVPPLFLQPLVENALRHGIDPRPSGGTVTITARCRDGVLEIVVADDGVGVDPARRDDGLGLGVLRARLAERRPPGRLIIDTAPGRGFVATISLPVPA